MKKSLQFSTWWIWRSYSWFFILGIAALVGLAVSPSNETIQFINMILGTIIILVPTGWFMEGIHLPFFMGATRKKVFLTGQITKIPVIVFLLLQNWLKVGTEIQYMDTVKVLSTAFLLCSVAELIGIVATLFGRLGMIIIRILTAGYGAVVGFLFTLDISFLENILMELQQYQSMGGNFILGILLMLCSGVLFSKIQIK